MIGVALTLAPMSAAAGLPTFFALAVVYGALFGVSFVILPSLAGEAAPAQSGVAPPSTRSGSAPTWRSYSGHGGSVWWRSGGASAAP